jgi:hypothetical protein
MNKWQRETGRILAGKSLIINQCFHQFKASVKGRNYEPGKIIQEDRFNISIILQLARHKKKGDELPFYQKNIDSFEF